MNRRRFIAGTLATSASLAMPALAQPKPRRFIMLLNTSWSGPQAWLLLAQDKGYLAAEGIELDLTQGSGAYTAAPRMMASNFDLGYGDINSLIEIAAANPQSAPIGVFALFNASPSTIALRADGPIRTPRDLEGRTIVGHASDVALQTFPAFCRTAGVEAGKVNVRTFMGGMRSQVETMLTTDRIHGVFGYVSTIASAVAEGGRDINHRLRHFRFAEHVPDLYGSTLMISRKMLRDNRDAVAGIVRALNRGLAECVRSPEAGIDAVIRRASFADRNAEMLRLKTTFTIEMAHAEGRRLGIGAVDDKRLLRAIALVSETKNLKRKPELRDIFMPDFLPPPVERVRSLAA